MPSEFIQSCIDRLLAQAADAADELDWDGMVSAAQRVLTGQPEVKPAEG